MQLTPFLTSKYTVDSVITNLCVTFVFVGLLVEYNSFYVNRKTVSSVFDVLYIVLKSRTSLHIVFITVLSFFNIKYSIDNVGKIFNRRTAMYL